MANPQEEAPILEALGPVERESGSRFGAPGHASGAAATDDILKLIGRRAFQADVLSPKGLDDRSERRQVLQRAHALAADAWGAELCRFSTGGSTQSLHTALSAVARPGDTVLIAQNAHKAEFSAAIFSGFDIAVIPATPDKAFDLEHGIPVAAMRTALDAYPQAKAALVVSPTYFGVTSNIPALAALCHERGVPLIVDAAWGAAFGFNDRLPVNPVRAGADVVVVSIHKTLAGLGQASAMFVSGDLIDRERFALAFELFQTTSPSVPILASIDATRRAHALHGQRMWGRVLELARRTRAQLAKIDGVRVLGREALDGDGAHDLDQTKITFDISALGIAGYSADDWLIAHHRVTLGLSDAINLLAIFSLGTRASDARRLVAAIRALSAHARAHPEAFKPAPRGPRLRDLGFELAMPIGAALAGPSEHVPYGEAAGRIAAEIIAPAPPGVPRLVPGQRITLAHVEYLVGNREAGMFVLDPADPSNRSIRVVRDSGAS